MTFNLRDVVLWPHLKYYFPHQQQCLKLYFTPLCVKWTIVMETIKYSIGLQNLPTARAVNSSIAHNRCFHALIVVQYTTLDFVLTFYANKFLIKFLFVARQRLNAIKLFFKNCIFLWGLKLESNKVWHN